MFICYSAFLSAFDLSACRIVVLRKKIHFNTFFCSPFFQNLFLNNAFLHNLCRVGKFFTQIFFCNPSHIFAPALRESFGIHHHHIIEINHRRPGNITSSTPNLSSIPDLRWRVIFPLFKSLTTSSAELSDSLFSHSRQDPSSAVPDSCFRPHEYNRGGHERSG